MARIPSEIKITDTELLLCINRLRRAEDRQPLVSLPLPYSFLSDDQRYNIYTRYDSEYRIHLRDKTKFLDYKYQIILNKTEHKLYVHNKARSARHQPQLHYLPFKSIAAQDIKYYFPSSRFTSPKQIFITDTDSKYITSVIQVTSGNSSQIRASHTFHLSISFNNQISGFTPPRCSSPEFFTPQTSIEDKTPIEDKTTTIEATNIDNSSEFPPVLLKTILPRVYPDLTDIFTMSSPSKRPHSSSPHKPSAPPRNLFGDDKTFQFSPSKLGGTNRPKTASPTCNQTIEFSPSKLASAVRAAAFTEYRDQTLNRESTDTILGQNTNEYRLFDTPTPTSSPLRSQNFREIWSNTGAIPKGTPPEIKNTGAIPKGTPPENKITDDKDRIIAEAQKATQLLIQQNTDLRNSVVLLRQQMDNLVIMQNQLVANSPQKSNPFPTPSPPKTPPLSPPKSPVFNFPIIPQSPPKFPSPPPKSSIESQYVKNLQSQMEEIAKQLNSFKIQVENTDKKIESVQLTNEERTALLRIANKQDPIASTLIFALEKPTNIIPLSEPREPKFLSILKGHAAVATLGVFDPDKHPSVKFRDMWDRILNYTKNYKLYEHEYVDLLMVVMKGSAATNLNGILREFQGDLNNVISAIQDIYVPQHTIYDDIEELNSFKRLANENIKSTMRRASMIIDRLKPTCSQHAWPERKYHLLLTLLKQLIDKKTFKELHMYELEAAQLGITRTILQIIDKVALIEAGNDSIPKQETGLVYNINSLQLTNQQDGALNEIEQLKVQVNSLLPKKPRLDERGKFRSNPHPRPSTGGLKRPFPGSDRRNAGSSQSSSFSFPSSSSSYNPRAPFPNSQRRPDGRRDFRQSSMSSNRSYPDVNRWLNSSNSSNQRPKLSTQRWRESRSKSRDRFQQSRGPRSFSSSSNFQFPNRQSRSHSRDQNRGKYDRYRSNSRGRSSSQNSYRDRYNPNSNNRGRSFNKSFGKGTNTVTMTFYQCKLCPKTHLKGTTCNSNKT